MSSPISSTGFAGLAPNQIGVMRLWADMEWSPKGFPDVQGIVDHEFRIA